MRRDLRNIVALAQGIYYGIMGIWPLVAMESFIAVSGPKEDLWLVRTVGALVLCSALVLLTASYRRRIHTEVVLLALSNAGAFILVDVIFVAQDLISPVYLLDALAHVLLLAAWLFALWRSRGEMKSGAEA